MATNKKKKDNAPNGKETTNGVKNGKTSFFPKTRKLSKAIEFDPEVNPNSNAYLAQYALPNDRPVRIYCDGIYDLFHYGHARSLEQVKKLFPNVYLLVGVCSDQLTNKYKGKTVMNEEQRYESLRHCRWVDEVVQDAPWVVTQEFIDKHKIDFVAHDDIPYASQGQEDVYKFVKDQNKFIATKRTSGISTSDIITRIVYDYDTYVRRNLSRGVPPKDLNLSFFKESEIKVTDSVQQIKGKLKERFKSDEEDIKNNWTSTKDELFEILLKWESKSHDFVKEFTELFGIDGAMRRIFKISPVRKQPAELPDDNTSSDDGGQSSTSAFEAVQGLKRRFLAAFGDGGESDSSKPKTDEIDQ